MRGLPLDDAPAKRPRFTRALLLLLSLSTLGLTAVYLSQSRAIVDTVVAWSPPQRDFLLPLHCPAQPSAVAPPITFDPDALTEGQKSAFIERLRGAVRIRTETFDGAPSDGGDEWFDKFYAFEAYLEETFPDVFSTLKVEKFATHALLFTWEGSDASLKPLVVMAHQDTVPVPEETVSRWTHLPFDAHLDEKGWIWGRGVADCKNLLISELTAVSELLKAGFKPTRTVHVAFGFDEEGGVVHSADYIANHLESIYGRDGVFIIVDEGGLISKPSSPSSPIFITPSLGEKGTVNVQLSVNVPGGHSSVPPSHTAIGILSALISEVEANPPEVVLSRKNPWAQYWTCRNEYDAESLDPTLRQLLAHEKSWPVAAKWLANQTLQYAALLSTTQAVDIVSGGVKVNALPEEAHAIVNHRVSIDDSIPALEQRYIAWLTPVAKKYSLAVVGFGEEVPPNTRRYLQLSHPGNAREASPVTPAEGDAWNVFAATAKYLYPSAIVAPSLSGGGTDTRSFLNLTKAIYRSQAVRSDQRANGHTVDERVHVDAHLSSIQFVHALVQNVAG